MPSRQEILLGLFDPAGKGLEIGASYNPLAPKRAGFDVEVVDYTDRAGLLAKYSNDPNTDLSRIEEVDYVTAGGSMRDVIPHRSHYDYIIASHVIEHVPDLVDFLQTCAELLRPQGVLVLAVPDKRLCFDLLQPLSTTGAALQAHLERRQRPQPGMVFDSVAYDVLRGGALGWTHDNTDAPAFNATLETAYGIFRHAANFDGYIDVHVWRFVPSSFRLLIEDLHALGLSPLREHRFVTGEGPEFYVALSLAGSGPDRARIALATEALRELAAVRLDGPAG